MNALTCGGNEKILPHILPLHKNVKLIIENNIPECHLTPPKVSYKPNDRADAVVLPSPVNLKLCNV